MKIDILFGFDNFIDKITFDPTNVNIEMHRDREHSLPVRPGSTISRVLMPERKLLLAG